MIESTEQAISILQNTKLSELEREEAVHYLEQNPSSEGNQALVAGLEDDDHGVGWACGAALAVLGEPAFVSLLEALNQPDTSIRLRNGARHVIHYNSNPKIRSRAAKLMKALKGQGSALSTAVEAHNLLTQLK